MSTIAISGLYERTFKSRSSAVPACPTISNPLRSSRLATPSRRSTESSASTTRIRAAAACLRFGSSSTLRVSPKGRPRLNVDVGSARTREQCLDRRRRQLGFGNEAERGAARDERPKISAIEARHEDHRGCQLERTKLLCDVESVGI